MRGPSMRQVCRPQQECYVRVCVAVGVQAGARTRLCTHSMCACAH